MAELSNIILILMFVLWLAGALVCINALNAWVRKIKRRKRGYYEHKEE